MKAIYIDPNGIAKYHHEWPEKVNVFEGHIHKDLELWDSIAEKEYQSALSKAKSEAVEFADQDGGFRLADGSKHHSFLSFIIDLKSKGYDTFYPLPKGIEIEVREELKNRHRTQNPRFAYIKSSSDKPVESQQELWREAAHIINSKPWNKAFTELQKHFSIRKEP